MTDWHDTRSAGGTRGAGTVAEFPSAAPAWHAETQTPESDPPNGVTPQPGGSDGRVHLPGSDCDDLGSGSLTVRKLAQILDLVRDVPGCSAVYRDAVRLLHDLHQSCLRDERHYAELLDLLLRHQSQVRGRDAEARTEFEVLRRHLRPPIMAADAAELKSRLESLLDRQPAAEANGTSIRPFTDADDIEIAADSASESAAPRWTGRDSRQPAAQEPDSDDFQAMAAQREAKIDGLQESLGREIRETLAQNEEFGVMLDLVLSELQRAREVGDAHKVRERLLEQVKRLHSGHFSLAQKLDSADRYLSMLSLDSRHLNEELHRVRELSLTDELTSLPNRRAFMARVEEEVARVERYGMPLSLAIIDLDSFKRVNDQYGHAAGDEVLRCYATQIFSVFRNHDLVARYGGEEFAVLLPNTDHRGAAAALRKARESAARLRCRGAETAFPVPSFSAGVATLQRGETPQRLIDRADEALYRAKRSGRDRVEFADAAKS